MSASRGALLAIDLGSTAVKVLIVEAESGRPLALTRAGSGPQTSDGGSIAEGDPNAWWEAITAAVHEALAAAGPNVEILAIAADGHGPTLVPVRANGSAASPAMLWRDRRDAADNAHLAALLHRTGWLLAELPKARWFLRERRAAAKETAWLLSTWDALAFRMSGEAVASFWDPARSLAPADRAVLVGEAGGLDARALPPEVHPGTRIGSLRADAAAALGLPVGVPVISGTNDGMAAVVGAGLWNVGRGVDVGGAAGGVGVAADPAVAARISAALGGALWSGPAPVPFGDLRILGGALGGTGLLLDAVFNAAIAGGADPEALIEAAAELPLGAEGATVERAATAAHRLRAAMEHGALAVARLLAPARAAGLPLHEMWLSGSATGATSGLHAQRANVPRALPQMRADLLGVPVVLPRIGESAAAGSAALAGVGAGLYASLKEAVTVLAVVRERLDPNENTADVAADLLLRFTRDERAESAARD